MLYKIDNYFIPQTLNIISQIPLIKYQTKVPNGDCTWSWSVIPFVSPGNRYPGHKVVRESNADDVTVMVTLVTSVLGVTTHREIL